jgi:integrase
LALQSIENAVNPSPAMKRKDKLGHKDGTQSPVEPMPKHPHILKRDGRYYYRRRIPTELVDAGCYGKAKDIKRSLKTGDLATARSRAMTVALEVDEDFKAKWRNVGKASSFAKSANSSKSPATRKLSDLSEIARRDFIIRAFIAREKEEIGCRSWESDPVVREPKLESAREDLAALEGSTHFQETDWLAMTRKAMEAEGISTDGEEEAKVRAVADMLRRAIIESGWRTERAILGSPYAGRDSYFDGWHADSPMPAPVKASKTVGDLSREFMADVGERAKAGNLRPSSVKAAGQSAKVMVDFFGQGTPLSSITKKDAARLVAFLPTLPKNGPKRYKGLSLVVAAEREAKQNLKQLIGPKTVEGYLEGVSSIFKFAVEWHWLVENPFVGRFIKERLPKVVVRHRQTMSPEEMTKMFSSPDFLSQRSGVKGTKEVRFWLPLLCLFHGTRANEVAGMLISDVNETNGIVFLNLRESDEHRLKTETSVRAVPLHRVLLELGFLEFVSRRRDGDPKGYLFTGLNRNTNGSMADAVCKWWARQIDALFGTSSDDGPTGGRGIHSLRHSWVAAEVMTTFALAQESMISATPPMWSSCQCVITTNLTAVASSTPIPSR